jgi:hypothetical protein
VAYKAQRKHAFQSRNIEHGFGENYVRFHFTHQLRNHFTIQSELATKSCA